MSTPNYDASAVPTDQALPAEIGIAASANSNESSNIKNGHNSQIEDTQAQLAENNSIPADGKVRSGANQKITALPSSQAQIDFFADKMPEEPGSAQLHQLYLSPSQGSMKDLPPTP